MNPSGNKRAWESADVIHTSQSSRQGATWRKTESESGEAKGRYLLQNMLVKL